MINEGAIHLSFKFNLLIADGTRIEVSPCGGEVGASVGGGRLGRRGGRGGGDWILPAYTQQPERFPPPPDDSRRWRRNRRRGQGLLDRPDNEVRQAAASLNDSRHISTVDGLYKDS